MTARKKIFYTGLVLAAGLMLAVTALLPVKQNNIITRGIDEYNAHLSIFGKHDRAQEINLKNDIIGAGAILVGLKRKNDMVDVKIVVKSGQTGIELAEATIAKDQIKDDTFSYELFDRPVTKNNGLVIVSFSAPQATINNPVGIRTDLNQPKKLAVILIERVAIWQAIMNGFLANKEKLVPLGIAWAMAAVMACIAVKFGWSRRTPKLSRRIEQIIIIVLVIVAIAARISWLPKIHGVSGGDPYNYLGITKGIINGQNPLTIEKRLPGLPLLLAPSYVLRGMDDILVMRLIEIFSAGGLMYCLYIMVRKLGLPWPVQFLSVALLAVQKDFFWTSLRPEPYTFYGFLVWLALWLFLNIRKKWVPLIFGLVIGYAAMTRQEGFVLAVTFGLAAAVEIFYRSYIMKCHINKEAGPAAPAPPPDGFAKAAGARRGSPGASPALLTKWHFIRRYVVAFLIGLLVVLPFLISNWKAYGNPLYTPYFASDRLNIVDSWNTWNDNRTAFFDILGSMWRPSWKQLQETRFNNPLIAAATVVTVGWWFANACQTRKALSKFSWWPSTITLLAAMVILVSSSIIALFYRAMFVSWVASLATGVLLAGVPIFLATTSWSGLIVLGVLLGQIMIPIWFHPFAKHLQQSYPLFLLLVATALFSIRINKKSGQQMISAVKLFTLLVPFCLVTVMLASQQTAFIDASNQETALDHVLYQAIKVTQLQPGPYGFDSDYQPVFVYFGDQAKIFKQNSDEGAWLMENNIKTMLTTSLQPQFEWPDGWRKIASFKTEEEGEKIVESSVYYKVK